MAGYFYHEKAGKVVGKFVVDDNATVPDQPGCKIVRVETEDAFNEIKVWTDPELAKEQADRQKITEKIESMAVAELKKDNHVFESVKFKDK